MGAKQNNVKILTKTIPFRKDFYKATKEPNESSEQWLSRVKELAKSCGFGTHNDQFIANKFIMGLESETIDYLCSSADSLDVAGSLKFIREYEKQKNDLTLNAPTVVETETEPLLEPPESIFSETLMKVETEYSGDDQNHWNSDDSDQFDDDDSKDSDYVCEEETKKKTVVKKEKVTKIKNEDVVEEHKSDTEVVAPKRRGRPKTKIESKKEPQDVDNVTEVDPNAPKKKRKYKQRAIKEKQTFECEVCGYKVKHQCHLKRHMLIHENEKSFICHECGKGFNLFINLNAHLRRHAGYKPHSCDVCQASFIDKTRLRLHMRTHTGERPYSCQFCDKSFADRYYLKIHTRLHTGERPFQCDQCHRTFSQSSSLSVHKRKSCMIGQLSFQ